MTITFADWYRALPAERQKLIKDQKLFLTTAQAFAHGRDIGRQEGKEEVFQWIDDLRNESNNNHWFVTLHRTMARLLERKSKS